MQGDPSVRDEPLYATPPPEGLPGAPEGALIRLDRGVWAGQWHVGVAIMNCLQLKEEGYEMNVYQPCLFSKFAVREEPAVDGGSIAPGEFVGCVLLEVDDHLMGGLERHIMKVWRDYGRRSNWESGTRCCRTGRLSSEDATSHSYQIEVSRLT